MAGLILIFGAGDGVRDLSPATGLECSLWVFRGFELAATDVPPPTGLVIVASHQDLLGFLDWQD